MATLVLGAAGAALGGALLPTISLFGQALTGAAIGGMIGSALGSAVDAWLVAGLQPGQRYEGQRLDTTRITSSTEGVVIPRVFGSVRLGGNVIWATDFREEVTEETQGGKGGGAGEVTTTEYTYYASFAVAICEGTISGIGRIWADGELLDTTKFTIRKYRGTEGQTPDPLIQSLMGSGKTPAYRGTAYVVFEDALLTDFGNRIPQLTFEVFRPLADGDTAEGMVKAVTLIPGTGEFAYATTVVRTGSGGLDTLAGNGGFVNSNSETDRSDIAIALDRLGGLVPNVESVSLVTSWFGDDLRAAACNIRPGVEVATKSTSPLTWSVNGVSRSGAHLVSQSGGKPVYGGTPSDESVVQAIKTLKARGKRVTFYPFILMDIPAGNTKPNPYSDGAAAIGQPVFPWRGRITCSPAPGYASTAQGTSAVSTQVLAFFGSAAVGDFNVSGETVTWTGASGEWGYRRMILHYAHLCKAAGGVDTFLIGSELRGLTWCKSDSGGSYQAVGRLTSLAADVRSILGAGTEISYAADWSEYFGHQPADGSGDVFFHLDQLWASANIDFVGIDNYMPLADWRDGWEHTDAVGGARSIYDLGYLRSNVAGGEGFDWYYPTAGERALQERIPITDGAHGKPWVFRYKDLVSWWSNQHRHRPGGVEGGLSAWVPQSKPIRFTEFGCPAIDRGANQPNVFVDPKSSESFVPYFSRGWRDDAMQRAYLEATLGYWGDNANNPASSVYSGRMLDLSECAAWTWDARPYPYFPNLTDVWSDGENWQLGHWLSGRLGAVSLRALVRRLCTDAGLPSNRVDVSSLTGAVEGYTITAIEAAKTSISMLARHFGFDACESEGVIRFVSRGGAEAARVTPDEMVAGDGGEVFEITRGQESEIPQALKWQLARNDGEYDLVMVEARRATVNSARISSESFPMVVPPEEGDRRCRRALQEAWVARERATFVLPPSRLALDPTDVVTLEHDGRDYQFRLNSISDNDARVMEAVRQDRDVYDLPPGITRRGKLPRPMFYGAPTLVFMNLPMISEAHQSHWPLLAVSAAQWPGQMAVYRSLEANEGYTRLTNISRRAKIGRTAFDFYSGPVHRFDYGNELYVDMTFGGLVSVNDQALFDGANTIALQTADNDWEIVQFGNAELVSSGRYKLTRLLRGQRGTEHFMKGMVAGGARVVVLDKAITGLPIGRNDVGDTWYWRVGPASKPVSDASYQQVEFTPNGRGAEPFSGVHAVQPWKTPGTPGDRTITWIRRSRILSADIWSAGEVALGEESAEYLVHIMDGSTVKRQISTTSTSLVYTAAQQVADWGAAIPNGGSLSLRFYQVAPLVGAGFIYATTLYF